MDNLTHGLLGAAIGMVRRRDGGPEADLPPSATDRAVLLGAILAAELPDIDTFFGTGPMGGLLHHRGWTHSVAAAPLVALAASGLAKLIWREARFQTVAAWSLASVLFAHLLNDWMTSWGTRLLLPWSEARLALDWVSIIDMLYTLPLLAAALIARRRPKLRRKAASAVLLYLVAYSTLYRGTAHFVVNRTVAAHYQGQTVAQMRVFPHIIDPLRWQYTVDLGDRYEQGEAYPFGSLRPGFTVRKSPEDEVVRAVRAAPELQPFFAQFAYPVIQYRRTGPGYEATLGDVRYQFAGRGMTYAVVLDERLRVLEIK